MVILLLILLVTVPSITKTLKNKKEEEYQRYLNDIYLATESYIGMRQQNYRELVYSNKAVVELQELIEAGYISENKVNPKTKEKINPLETIEIIKDEDGFYHYHMSGKENGFHSYTTDGLLVWYDGKIHGDSEYVWQDLSGYDHHGILYQYSNNAFGVWKDNALTFDGNDDYVDMNFDPTVLGQNFTVSITFCPDMYYGNLSEIIGGYSNLNKIAKGFFIRFKNDDFQVGYGNSSYYSNDGNYIYEVLDGGSFLNVIHQVTVLFSGNQSIQVYVDGVLKQDFSIVADGDYLGEIVHLNRMRLGVSAIMEDYTEDGWKDLVATNHYFFGGSLYGVRIYDHIISEDEIVKNYEIDRVRFGLSDSFDAS